MIKKIEDITKSNKKVTILNVSLSLLYEIIYIIYGLVVPRLILEAFGSEVNGLCASITQFLNLITIIEGGIGGVVKAALYKPLAENDEKKLSSVFKTATSFYKKLATIYIIYGVFVAVFYPLIFNINFSWQFTFALILIIASQSFIQYFFSLNLRTLITADRKGFIVSLISIFMQFLSFLLVIIVINIFPSILLLKGAGAIIYIIQPVLYNIFAKKHYKIDKNAPADTDSLKQRWEGFGHNLAYFIHTNTDIVLLTILGSLFDVSVYGVYFMIVVSLKTFVLSITSAITPTIGNVLVKGTNESKNLAFDIYLFVSNFITTIIFTCGLILITPFVSLYTAGINDANYYQPFLGYFLILAEAAYCYRDPYVSVAFAAGHFKQTTIYAYVETGINIILSVALYYILGIAGIAFATMLAMIYRFVCHVIYLKKNILYRSLRKTLKSFLIQFLTMASIFIITLTVNFKATNYFEWFIYASCVFVGVSVLLVILSFIFDKEACNIFIKYIFKKDIFYKHKVK